MFEILSRYTFKFYVVYIFRYNFVHHIFILLNKLQNEFLSVTGLKYGNVCLSLRDGLSPGSSRHWREALFVMTGEREMNGAALLEYFQPLYEFLKAENDDGSTTAAGTSTTSGNYNSNTEEDTDQTVPIVIGAVLLAVVVVVIVGYLVFRRRAAKRNESV